MNLIKISIIPLICAALIIIGHYCGWNMGRLSNPIYAAFVTGLFIGCGSTLLSVELPKKKEQNIRKRSD